MKSNFWIIFIIVALFAYSFGVCALGVWLLSLAFGFTVTIWKILAVWVFILFISGGIKITLSQ